MREATMEDLVLRIDSPEATLATAGGKGASLSHLARAGFPVPAGYLIATEAYEAFVRDNDLEERIVALAGSGAGTDFEDVSTSIRQLFERSPIPPRVARAIHQGHAALCPEGDEQAPLAVRSSATAEDLPGASFAGQQDTYLNVRGERALLEAVKRCWSSLWTARALAYRVRQGIDPATVSLAVVVQALVPADAAGVLFTANPLTGARDEVVISAAWGLGEAVVSGQVTPDQVIADKATGAITQRETAEKTVMTAPTSTGTEERAVAADRRRAQVLDAAQVARLVTLASAVEASIGAPQDIEWCLAGDRLWIVQSRPITTLPPEPVHWRSPVPGAKWIKDLQAAEWATEPLSPLGATTTFAAMIAYRQRRLPMQRSPWSALINGWLYVRADFRLAWLVTPLGGLIAAARARTLGGRRRMSGTWPRRLALLDSVERTDLGGLSDDELRARADRLLDELGFWWWEVTLYAAAALVSEQLIGRLGVPGLADPAVLFRGNDSLLLEEERALHRAARSGEIDDYLARFGHFVESADPIHPTLRESPDLVAQSLAAARNAKMGPDERLARIRRERTDAEGVMRVRQGLRGRLARGLLRLGQGYAAYVDDSVFHLQRVLALLRGTYVEAGVRLAGARALERAEDVFYLERGELWAPPADLRERVNERRLLRERQKRLAPPPYVPLLSDPAWARDRMWRLFGSALGRCSLAACRSARGGGYSLARRAARAAHAASRGSSRGRPTSTASSRVTCSSPTPRRRSGHPS
jgi:hypothetical protein